jgi:hypothetical protein
MSQDSELRRLEQFVEKLLVRFSELRAEKERLLHDLRERELQVEELSTNLSSREMERSEISQRVSKIVEQIEEWEMGLDEITAVTSDSEVIDEPLAVPEDASSQETKDVPELRGEEEGRVQHNLFSIGNTHR